MTSSLFRGRDFPPSFPPLAPTYESDGVYSHRALSSISASVLGVIHAESTS